MPNTRQKIKNRKESGTFLLLPHAVMDSANFKSLHPRAIKLLLNLARQYNGHNNGDLCAAMTLMRKCGWTSNDQLQKAIKELLEKGWITITRKTGRLSKIPYLYALTFHAIDECKGKLDCKPTRTAPGNWKNWEP